MSEKHSERKSALQPKGITKTQRALYIVEDMLEKVTFVRSALSPNAIIAEEINTLRNIRRKVKGIESEFLKKMYRELDKINPYNPKSVMRRVARIKKMIRDYSKKVAPVSSQAVYDNSKRFYKKIKKALSRKFGYPYSFVQPDLVAIDRVNKFQNIFIGKQYRDNVTGQVQRIIVETIEKNKGVLSRDLIAKEIKKKLPQYAAQKGYFQVVAGQVLNTARSYSHCRFYSEAQIEQYEILAIIDRVTSDQCKFMDGTVLSVERTLKQFEKYDEADSIEDVKAVNPWLTASKGVVSLSGQVLTPDLTGEELQAMGVNAPPYHGRCRSTVAPVL